MLSVSSHGGRFPQGEGGGVSHCHPHHARGARLPAVRPRGTESGPRPVGGLLRGGKTPLQHDYHIVVYSISV